MRSLQRRFCSDAFPGVVLRTAGYQPLLLIEYMRKAFPISFSDAWHLMLLAERRALASVGSSTEMRTAMMPITTRSSTSVKPLGRERPRGEQGTQVIINSLLGKRLE